MAVLDNGTQINTIIPGFIENHFLDVGTLLDLMGGMTSHLHRPGKHLHLTYWLYHNTGSSSMESRAMMRIK